MIFRARVFIRTDPGHCAFVCRFVHCVERGAEVPTDLGSTRRARQSFRALRRISPFPYSHGSGWNARPTIPWIAVLAPADRLKTLARPAASSHADPDRLRFGPCSAKTLPSDTGHSILLVSDDA